MSRSAFSGVKLSLPEALDQRLVAPSSADEPSVNSSAPTLAQSNELSHEHSRARSFAGSNTRSAEDPSAQTRKAAHAAGRAGAMPASQIRSSDRRATRPVERYSHDLFKDQVRWINRLKLDIEEQEGVRITGNAIVQLALDLLRDDFDVHSSESALVRVLVRGHDWRDVRPSSPEPVEEAAV